MQTWRYRSVVKYPCWSRREHFPHGFCLSLVEWHFKLSLSDGSPARVSHYICYVHWPVHQMPVLCCRQIYSGILPINPLTCCLSPHGHNLLVCFPFSMIGLWISKSWAFWAPFTSISCSEAQASDAGVYSFAKSILSQICQGSVLLLTLAGSIFEFKVF